MNWLSRKILYIDLEKQTFDFKNDSNLGKYIGGLGMAAKYMFDSEDKDIVIFSVGPLSGVFPFASKTSVFFYVDKYIDSYLGGTLSSRMKFADIDMIVLVGNSRKEVVLDISSDAVNFRLGETDVGGLGLPGKRSVLSVESKELLLDDYFTTSPALYKNLKNKNVRALVVTGDISSPIQNIERYTDIYKTILSMSDKLTVQKGGNPSCFGCPMGCNNSKMGELGGNILVHSLVGCEYASKIYEDENLVFSCLNILGYGYTHEDIENFPKQVNSVLDSLGQR